MNKLIVSTEEITTRAKAGKMFILIDDESRENEGDLVIAAEFADASAINFMATFGRGLICLPLTKARVDYLQLPMMTAHNTSRLKTAFTISIEAKEGITTGISAFDRAKTVSVAIGDGTSAADLCSPGHIFPLVAKSGGVLERPGHTEASVEIMKLAGLKPAAVICEIMKDDGTMARLADLQGFAERHGLVIGTIADLLVYVKRSYASNFLPTIS